MTSERTNGSKTKPRETIPRLQRGILRLVQSYHGQNPELDGHLHELGVLVRSGTKDERLQRLIDEIVDTIVSQDIAQNTSLKGGCTLCGLLERIAAKFPESTQLQSIIARIELPLDKQSFKQALDDAADTIATIARQAPVVDDSVQHALTHLFDNIDFPSDVAADIDALKTRLRSRKGEIELVRSLDAAASIISNQIANIGDATPIAGARDQLLLLMNLIPFPASLTERSSQTRRTIEQTETAAALYGCIPEIADLTGMMRVQLQSEIDELGNFLKSTLKRLQDFESQILQSDKFHEQSLRNTLDLETNIGERSNRIRANIDDETDINAIKSALSTHLDSIDECLGEFVRKEDTRHNSARKRINEMVSALNELEFEAKELRDNLEKQHEQVLIDPLTGILNRTGYNENINKEYVRWRRYEGNLSLAVIDLDLFKNINDSFGHSIGDKVLSTVARQLEAQIRECDILCRYGGEEFALLLPETSVADAFVMVEKLRVSIAECQFHLQDRPVPVTMSCGIAGFRKDDTISEVFERADRAMYLAKRDGRNQVRTEDELQEVSA
ncbi:MAG: GGDEF domain-containing protein [Gammaproteobacteria bacterium]